LIANDGHESDIAEIAHIPSRANDRMLQHNPSQSSGGDRNMGSNQKSSSSAKYLEQMKHESRKQTKKIALSRGDPAAALMAISESETN